MEWLSKIVGVVLKHGSRESYQKNKRSFTTLSDEIKQALFDFDLIPIGILTPKEEVSFESKATDPHLNKTQLEILKNEVSICNGLVFQGGIHYDDYEYDIARFAYQNDIPTLGICCGQSIMTLALGGDIAIVSKETHKSVDEYVHDCRVVTGTRFHHYVQTDSMIVNSRHTRSVINPGPYLTTSAIDCDGNAEVVEAEDKKYFIGVRFHPESLYKKDKNMAAVFESFAQTVKRL
ncbi:gamma-glutamyl-gamma-aminobutyrate hydrolase family protein [Candidatus Saccharibacteria bacterium]|nr:gamma-glutamyl-gamma-aminobutyrate hydrolase family protein [Candidatus Saccharibacteria bacterium]